MGRQVRKLSTFVSKYVTKNIYITTVNNENNLTACSYILRNLYMVANSRADQIMCIQRTIYMKHNIGFNDKSHYKY